MGKGYYFISFFWSTFAKIVNALFGFISVPILLDYFGVNNFGVLTLALSANAYMQILDLGINIGSIKFFSQWRKLNDYDLIHRVAGTSITSYVILGVVNALILILVAVFANRIFSNLTLDELNSLRLALSVLACFSVFNWVSMVLQQLIVAADNIAFNEKILSFVALSKIALVFITVFAHLTLIQYFSCLMSIITLPIIAYGMKAKRLNMIQSFKPTFYWNDIKPVLLYSFSIFGLSLFQMTASQSRPVILGIFGEFPTVLSSEYKIISLFPAFVLATGGALAKIFLPKASQLALTEDKNKINSFLLKSTKMTSLIGALLSLFVLLNSEELLNLLVGGDYNHLTKWLMLSAFSILLYLYTAPCTSLVLATGKTKEFVIMTGVACVVSIIANALLVTEFEVGSAIIGFLLYIVFVELFRYMYLVPKVLKLNPIALFGTFFKPTIIGILTCFLILALFPQFTFQLPEKLDIIIRIAIKSSLWIIIFGAMLIIFRVYSIKELIKSFSK